MLVFNFFFHSGLLERDDIKNVDYFVVIDFEATCEERNPPGYPHEIIEFPAVLVSCKVVSNLLFSDEKKTSGSTYCDFV